jgi:hypothetical protein
MTRGDEFFVGWVGRVPPRHKRFLTMLVAGALCGFVLLAVALARGTDGPGPGGYDWDAGAQTVRGVLTALPYPLLRLANGHTLLLAAPGKANVAVDAALEGRVVEAKGFMLKRGSLDMLEVGDTLTAVDAPAAAAPPVPLGRWRITGEICDGKCYSGAMRPGAGLAHRACANLCLIGGVPPVFVSTAAVQGSDFLLLADASGGPLPDAVRDLVALRVRLDGALERRGDLLVFKVNLGTAVLP